MEAVKIDKPWGYEKLIEKNENYVVKLLFMKAGHKCSLQYHKEKHETIYILEGTLLISIGVDKDNLISKLYKKGEYIAIVPGVVHRMEGYTDCLYMESSTPQLEDVIRLSDDYNRVEI